MRILFVCLGNICRSPAAEGVTRALAAGRDWVIDSAGTSGWHIGDPPYPPMIRAAADRGFDLTSQRARQFVAADFEQFDLIIGMDTANVAAIENLRPEGNAVPVNRFLEFAEGTGASDVPDPYYTGDIEESLDLIEAAASGLLGQLPN